MFRVLVVTVLCLLSCQALAKEEPYVFGVFPWARESLVRSIFEPIVEVMEKETGRPVVIEVPATYEKFFAAASHGEFDFVYSPLGFEHILISDYGFQRLVAFDPPARPFICARKGDPIQSLSELRGKRIAMMPRLTVASTILENRLREAGLDPEKDVTLIWHDSHEAVVFSLLVRESDFALTTPGTVRLLSQGLWNELSLVYSLGLFPHTELLSSKSVPLVAQSRLQSALIDLTKEVVLPGEDPARSGYRFIAPVPDSMAEYEVIGNLVRKKMRSLNLP